MPQEFEGQTYPELNITRCVETNQRNHAAGGLTFDPIVAVTM